MNRKRIFALITSFAFVATLVAPVAFATTSADEMQALITQLTAQINQLQAQLEGMDGTVVPAFTGIPAGFTFATNLRLGSSGDDVKYLQIVLNGDSATQLAASGVGSPGQETSYFGPLTEAGVVKFQNLYATEVLAPHGLTAGTGFVGTTTRAKLNDMLLAATEPVWEDEDEDEDEEEWEDEEEEEEPVVTGLEVSLGASNPAAGYVLVDNTNTTAETMKLMGAYNFSAGEATTVTNITFTRKGFVVDGDIDNLYLYADGVLVSDYAINTASRKFKFSDANGLFSVVAGSSVAVQLYMNINDQAGAAQTIGFDVLAAGDVVSDATLVSGFPLIGSTMTVANVTMATLGVEVTATAPSDLRIGSTDVLLAEVRLTPNNNDILVRDLAFTLVGTLSTSDLRNFKFIDSNDNVLATQSALSLGKEIVFNGLDITLATAKLYEIRGDIVGGPARTFDITTEEQNDVRAEDVQYGVRVTSALTNNHGGPHAIAAGNFEVIRAASSPVGGTALGATNVVLARYEFTARGERVRVNEMNVELNATNGKVFRNVKVLVDGVQKGNTAATLTTAGANVIVNNFTFGNTFNISLGQKAVVEIVADLDSATLLANDLIQVQGVAGTDIDYRLMDSLTDAAMITPDGLVLKLTTANLVTEVSTATPIASILSMGKTYEVARWRVEAENEGIRIYDVRLGATNLISTNGNVTQVALKLYEGTTLKQTATRTIYEDTGVVFGNTAVIGVGAPYGDYPAESRLNWDLKEDTAYSLALEITAQGYADGFGAVSGNTINATLDVINYRTSETNQDVLSGALALTGNTHELRRGALSITKDDVLKTGQVKGPGREVFNFTAAAEAGARRVTLRAFSLLVSGDNVLKITGTGVLNVHAGSTGNPVVARLRNVIPADTDITGATTVTNLNFAADPGLAVGDVINVDDTGALVNVVVVAKVDATNYTVKLLDGTDLAAIDKTVAAATGDAVFLAETTLFIPAITDVRVTEGTSTTFIVTGDTGGTLTTADQVNIRLDSATDVWWWDETVVTDPINTARVSAFPVQWALKY